MYSFDVTEFATRLSTIRKAQGMTQQGLAEALHISLEYLSKIAVSYTHLDVYKRQECYRRD